jgi:hypothetical protein
MRSKRSPRGSFARVSPSDSIAAECLAAILARFGPHPARAWALDLDSDHGCVEWLVACALLARSSEPARAGAALRALAEAGLDAASLAGTSPLPLARLLAREKLRDPDTLAPLLIRLARGVAGHCGGSLPALAARCDGLGELGSALAHLAPGFGAAQVASFVRPLRDVWISAREIPLDPHARAAALHLGMIGETDDEDGEPSCLRAALARVQRRAIAEPVDLCDAEWALAQLGRAACSRQRAERCPLGALCPTR